jgi:hypothetical protein
VTQIVKNETRTTDSATCKHSDEIESGAIHKKSKENHRPRRQLETGEFCRLLIK